MSKKNDECRFEQELLMNLESGDVKPHIEAHIGECPLCKETAAVYRWMNRFQQVSMEHQAPGKKLPSADAIWDGAFASPSPIFQRQTKPDRELVKKAMLPLLIPQVLTYIAIAVGLIYLAVANFPEIQQFFNVDVGVDGFFRSIARIVQKGSKIPLVYLVPIALTLVSMIFFMFTGDGKKEKQEN